VGGSRSHQRRRAQFVVCLALSIALGLGLAGTAWAAVTYGPTVKPLGPEQTVFDYTTDHCSVDAWDIPDQPARAFKDDHNPQRVHLHFDVASNRVYRNIGTSLDDASKVGRHNCSSSGVAISGGNPDPSMFDQYEWLTAPYTPDGHTVYSLTHEELRAWQSPNNCQLPANNDTTKCWYNAIVLYTSHNSGDWFDRFPDWPPPSHLVANVPYKWDTGTGTGPYTGKGPYGTYSPSNIIKKQPDDGYYYNLFRANLPSGPSTTCAMRTNDLSNPGSWRAWGDGPDADATDSYEVQFVNPYTYNFTGADPASAHMCKNVGAGSLDGASETLTYNSYYGKYMVAGTRGTWGSEPGFYYSLSDDLINWSPRQLLVGRDTQFSYQCGGPDPVVDISVLDPSSTSRNFETVGRDAYLYYVIFHPDSNCQFGPDRDMLRLQVRFSKAPTASFTVSPNPVPTGQQVTFDGSGSSDSDGTIANYKWDLDGNGTFETDSGTTPTTSRSYSVGGTVAVKLRVTDNDGAWNDKTVNLTVTSPQNQPPTAAFTPSPNPALTNQTVTFNGSASSDPDGTIANYKWDLDGNGTFETDSGTNSTTSRSYATSGTLTVKLRVTDTGGAINDTSRSLIITNRPPTASFAAAPNPAVTGQVVIFDGSTSGDLDGTIAKYEWDLDGNSTFETNTGANPKISRTYSAAATLIVGLRVTDNKGATATTTRVLTINLANGPVASMSITPNPAQAGQTVVLDGSASSGDGSTITKFEWDLDGDSAFETGTGSTPTASRSYATSGTLTLQLRVTDNNGLTGTTFGILTVDGSVVPEPFPAPSPIPTPSPAPSPPPATQQTSTQASCLATRNKRIARLTRALRRARRGLARAHTGAAKRRYRSQVKSLSKRLKRLRATSCS
jgi:PKD repeat protein